MLTLKDAVLVTVSVGTCVAGIYAIDKYNDSTDLGRVKKLATTYRDEVSRRLQDADFVGILNDEQLNTLKALLAYCEQVLQASSLSEALDPVAEVEFQISKIRRLFA